MYLGKAIITPYRLLCSPLLSVTIYLCPPKLKIEPSPHHPPVRLTVRLTVLLQGVRADLWNRLHPHAGNSLC